MTLGVSDLAKAGIRVVRLQYPDLHGICRGKDIPVAAFEAVVEEGIGFVEAIMTVDLRHNVTAGFEQGFPDIRARPDLSTLRPLPWDPRVAVCICDLFDSLSGEPLWNRKWCRMFVAGSTRVRTCIRPASSRPRRCSNRNVWSPGLTPII